jgi:hypothetical protein
MSQNSASLSRIQELKAQIAQLEKEGIQELRAKRKAIADEIATIDAQLAELTGVPVEKKTRAKAAPGRSIPLSELKDLLAAAPEKTLSIRKEGLELRGIKILAEANPHLLRIGGKGPWPVVTLLK